MNRRNALRNLGLTLGGATFGLDAFSKVNDNVYEYSIPKDPRHRKLAKPITAITLGAGGRGNVYGGFAEKHPDEVDIIGVAEPIELRRNRYKEKHAIPDANIFNTWEDVFKKPKF